MGAAVQRNSLIFLLISLLFPVKAIGLLRWAM